VETSHRSRLEGSSGYSFARLLGLIGEYIGRIYICINDSPQYVIKQVTGDRREL